MRVFILQLRHAFIWDLKGTEDDRLMGGRGYMGTSICRIRFLHLLKHFLSFFEKNPLSLSVTDPPTSHCSSETM